MLYSASHNIDLTYYDMGSINQFRQFNSLDPKELASSINQFRKFNSLDPKELAFNDAISDVCSPLESHHID